MRFQSVHAVVLAAVVSTAVHADIYQWEWIDPNDHTLGKQQSSTLAPDGAGRYAVPNADLGWVDLTMAWLRGFDLHDTSFSRTTLRDADFTNAEIRGADFDSTTDLGFTAEQLYSTASYQAGDLRRVSLTYGSAFTPCNVLSGWNFAGQNLSDSNFRGADLSDADLSDADLTNAGFSYATLGQAELTNATVKGTSFQSTGLTAEQLYSTASYQAGDLTGIVLGSANLSGWNFAGQNLSNAFFYGAILAEANFSRADARGATGLDVSSAVTRNFIHPDGHIEGLNVAAGQTMRLWDLDPNPNRYSWFDDTPIEDIPIVVEEDLSIDPAGTLRAVFEDDQWGSTITFKPGIPVTLAGTLELMFDNDVHPLTLVDTTYRLFDWNGVTPTGVFDAIVFHPGTTWDTSHLYTTGEATLIGAVPEPTTILLLSLGATVLFWGRWDARINDMD